MHFPKYLTTNTRDLELAIREGVRPMTQWYDAEHGGIPYFENIVTGPRFGNYHHTSWSIGHCPGRWMETLHSAQQAAGVPLDPAVFENLKKWVYRPYDSGLGLPANMDTSTFELIPEVDLCNLRESFYGLSTVFLRDRDPRALVIGEMALEVVARYLDPRTGAWDNERFRRDTGTRGVGLFTGDREKPRFCNTFGRFTGGLVRFYEAGGSERALNLALRLAGIAFETVVPEDGGFDPEKTAYHLYSTTSMLSGIAALASLTRDMAMFKRLKAFMENGCYKMGLNCGWVSENLHRDDLIGEINNSCDLLEVCLYLGKAGFAEYYERAERMLRGHILPAQLLDPCFISDAASDAPSRSRMASRVKGAFGFPCPYGHEAEPGSEISYNWDIIGGISGLCLAMRHRVTSPYAGLVSVNLLFDYHDEVVRVDSPYGRDDILSILLFDRRIVRIRLSERLDKKRLQDSLSEASLRAEMQDRWLYLSDLPLGQKVDIHLPLVSEDERCSFGGHEIAFRWHGDEVIAATSHGKRLCFFRELL